MTESLRQAILDDVFPLGSHLGEHDIAQRLDVSRGPVREALLHLRAEGIVTMKPHRGAAVVELDTTDILELTGLRTTLETYAIRLATAEATEEDIDALDRIVSDMEPVVAAGDVTALSRLDIRFHDGIYRAAHNARLEVAWQTIRSQWLLFLLRRASANRDYLSIALGEHRDLVTVLRRRDADAAVRMLTEHVHGAQERMLAAARVRA